MGVWQWGAHPGGGGGRFEECWQSCICTHNRWEDGQQLEWVQSESCIVVVVCGAYIGNNGTMASLHQRGINKAPAKE
jgi:hypothetical protein